jgi:hypothetical protein
MSKSNKYKRMILVKSHNKVRYAWMRCDWPCRKRWLHWCFSWSDGPWTVRTSRYVTLHSPRL